MRVMGLVAVVEKEVAAVVERERTTNAVMVKKGANLLTLMLTLMLTLILMLATMSTTMRRTRRT